MRAFRRLEPQEAIVGIDQTINIPLYNSSYNALAVSGYSATWKLFRAVGRRQRKPFTGTSVLEKTSAASEITLSDGNAAVAIADTDLSSLSGEYWQVLTLTDGSSNITQQAQGLVNLRAAA